MGGTTSCHAEEFERGYTDHISTQVARQAPVTSLVVKRRSGLLRSVLRQTVLPPTTGPASTTASLP